jgi:predicted RecA/RadA family phage recombinase
MAFVTDYETLPGLVAASNLASSQYLVGKLASTAGQVAAAGTLNSTTNPGAFVGVIMNKPAAGEEVEFAIDGIVKAIAATSTIAVGDRVYSNSTGRLTDAGTTDNGFFLGRALEAATAAGDIITIKLAGNGGGRY